MAERPGGRTARVRDAVLGATYVELIEHGYHGMSVDNVAKRAGVHKTTLYRRWGSVEGLLADALLKTASGEWSVPDTGNLEDDLTALNLEVLNADRELIHAVIGVGFQSESARTALTEFYQRRHEQASVVVTRAIERGEVPDGTSPVDVVRMTCAPMYYRLFITREPASEVDARQAARAAIAAAREGVFTS